MRINKYVAACTGMSRRAADAIIAEGQVTVNGQPSLTGQDVSASDVVIFNGKPLKLPAKQTILFHKPAGYITSRNGQGNKTIYDLLPFALHQLKPVGRLDKETSGLLILTNDGDLAQQLTHPGFHKVKIYEMTINKPLAPLHRQMISEMGIQLEDGPSKLHLDRLTEGNDKAWRVTMHEGRNRQIRRTFASLGYQVTSLHRTQFGNYHLGKLQAGGYEPIVT
jgi:23S rRNA pseudouridine2605 synthase